MRAVLSVVSIAGLAVLISGCVSAKINVVGERTALENQILGSYEELDRDMQLLASVRAVDAQGKTHQPQSYTQERRQAILARQTQQFNRDDIDELKQAGCIGETQDGSRDSRPTSSKEAESPVHTGKPPSSDCPHSTRSRGEADVHYRPGPPRRNWTGPRTT